MANGPASDMVDIRRLTTDLLALAVLAGTVYLSLCLLSYDVADPPASTVYPARADVRNIGGSYGAWIAHHLIATLGVGAFALPMMLAVWDLRLFSAEGPQDGVLRLIGGGMILTAVVIGLQIAPPVWSIIPPVGSGGYIGACGAILLQKHFEPTGVMIVIATLGLAGLVLSNELRLFSTLASACLLPLTMWDRLAFQRQVDDVDTAGQPASGIDVPASELDASDLHAQRTLPIVNAPPVMTPSPAVPVSAAPTAAGQSAVAQSPVAQDLTETTPHTAAGSAIKSSSGDSAQAATPPAAAASSPSTLSILNWFGGRQKSKPAAAVEEPVVETIPIRHPDVMAKPVAAINAPFSGSAWSTRLGLFGGEAEETRRSPTLPSLALLDGAEEFPYEVLAKKARQSAETLERTFQQFNLNVRVSEIDTGPVVTQYELELEPGLRLSKITSLADDLAIALRVPSVRVVAPIPGKNTVGVEVPNDVRVMVRLRELIENCPQELEDKRIPIFLGKDVRGQPLVVDMAKMPHLLIAGRTGTGKSVCLNTLILSMLMTRSPEQVKMLMIDPKMVELSPYMRIPHLMHPVITDMKKAEAVLGWAVDKMEERYDLLARVGVRHLDSYNKLGKEAVLDRLDIDPDSEEADLIPESMPYIVIVADEMADMIMTSGKEVEGHIIRLAQKSRAVGIHLVLATQKPTVDVITGLIKSNLPARIAFQVSSRMDSRVVLDEQGAEKLLGNGDLLYLAPGTSNLTRAQGSFVSDEEVMRVIDAFADQPPQYSEEIVQVTTAAGRAAAAKAGNGEARDRDDLYDQAVEIVIREGRGSVSLLQRALGVGYGRGARMIDWMAEDGIVGTYNGSQAREVVMTLEEWEDRKVGAC